MASKPSIWLRKITLSILIVYSVLSAHGQQFGKNGMVVSAVKLASQSGVEIMKKGGNAIDAAVTTAFVLAVTHPQAGNIGGGGFMVYVPANGNPTTIDFREKAPLAATPDMYLDAQGNLIEEINHKSIKSIGVPGTVAGLYKAHQKYGKLPWADLVQPAIDYAENGFPLHWQLYLSAKRIIENPESTPFMANYFLDQTGKLPEPGELWKQPELAETLKLIRDKGHDGFYKGRVAKAIAEYMKENGGLITKKDLSKYEAIERDPIHGTFKDYEIITMPPPSSGGVALVEMMNMMELVNFDSIEFNSTEYVHVVAETMRRAFADRAEFLGDPDFNPDMPVTELTSKDHASERFLSINPQKASISDSSRFGQLYEGTNTTHFSVIDNEGNAISLTYTLEYSYGSKLGVDELGFIFNNEMGDFNPVPGETTAEGQIGTAPNLIAPEKRMLSSMSPAIVTKNGKPYLIIGSPGGRTIINTVFQTVLNVIGYEMSLKEAIEAMKIHHQWLPDRIYFEEDLLSPDTRKNLTKMGHELVPINQLGALMGIMIDQDNQWYIGVSDSSRPDGGAVGY